MKYNIKISGVHYKELERHLFPGDGKEAVSIALCGRNFDQDGNNFMLVHQIINIPYEYCAIREPNKVEWSTEILSLYLEKVLNKGLAIIKIHCHPGGYEQFSDVDDDSDIELFDSIYGWTNNNLPHASMIMMPNGNLKARIVTDKLTFLNVDKISIIGDDLIFFNNNVKTFNSDSYNLRTKQAFGEGTVNILNNLRVGVIGCSGTGSPVIEQLARLGVGNLILIDPDEVEFKNLNRILNTTREDAELKRKKIDVLKKAIDKIGMETRVDVFPVNIYDDKEVINRIATCDIIFGCVDSIDGRHILNLIATFYLVSYFDIGVKLVADGMGNVSQICGSIHVLQPGGSSLRSRGVYNSEELRAAGLYRTNPESYKNLKKEGYVANVNIDSPAVISVNMFAASIAVNEFLARIHMFRYDNNAKFAITRFSNVDSYIQYEEDGESDLYLKKFVGRGEMRPLLNMPEL
ncbi:MAG: ThiF family adenylyltransferase [Lutibacter sp.]